MKSSNISLYKSTNSLNALDLENISLESLDRHSLYSNCSDCLYIVQPINDFEVKKSTSVAKSKSGDDLNKTFKQNKLSNGEFDENPIDKNQVKHDKVINWLRNT